VYPKDPGASGGMALAEPADELSADEESGTADGAATSPALWNVTNRAIDRVKVSLDLGKTDGPKVSTWRVVTLPRYRWYFAGSVASNFGTWLQNTTQVVLAYQLTHSAFWIGVVTCAQFTSPLLLGPWAGVWTHRLGTWRVLIATQCVSLVIAATLAALEFSGALRERWLIIGAVGIGVAFTFALPALAVTVPTLVPSGQVKRALAMDSVSYNLGRALGPVVGVLILATVGPSLAFALNAASFGFFTVVLLRLRPRGVKAETKRSRVMNGIRIALDDPRIMVLLLMVAAVTVAADPILVLGPALARSFGRSADWSGIFITALGAGNVIASVRPSRQKASIRRAAFALGILSIAMIVFVMAHAIWVSVAAALVAGMACLMAGATLKALLLHHAYKSADEDADADKRVGHQAAVMAAWAVAWAGSKPIASFADGMLASRFGVQGTGLLLATPALMPALVLIFVPAFGRRLVRHVTFERAS
jgi:predicted MFS family arabinose efflux permease